MRDSGLSEAIEAVGGVSELARRIGISQPSVSNWDKVPAERVLAVEAATGVARMRLRPDLYREQPVGDVDEIDLARSQEYALLSALLARAPDASLLQRLSRLGGDASPLGVAHAALGEAAARINASAIEREYFDLFIGLGRGELLPYASYYLTGFLNERPLARLRDDLAAFGVERVDGNYEPEDHAATLCEVMAGLIGRRFAAPEGAERRLFEKHMAPWMGRFFADLERAKAADFYRNVGTLGRVFIDIETEAFALPG
jgi:TorA maturation chaperone TorD